MSGKGYKIEFVVLLILGFLFSAWSGIGSIPAVIGCALLTTILSFFFYGLDDDCY